MSNSDNIVPMPDMSIIYSEASEWVVLLEDGDVSSEHLADFKAWYAKSEKHREAFEERTALWNDFDHIVLLNDFAASDETAEILKKDSSPFLPAALGRRSFLSAIAASFVLAIGTGVLFLENAENIIKLPTEFQTAIGEHKEIALSDGSTVNLNTDSKIQISYRDDARIVTLVRGEAYFNVERDPDRPFSVLARGKSVTAVGTAFTVRLLNEKVGVTVTHGRVALFGGPQEEVITDTPSRLLPKAPIAEIIAGQKAVFDKEIEHLDRVAPAVLARELSWRDGLLSFAGEPLSKVVSDVGRYTNITIEIEGDQFADLPISGYIKIGEYEEMFEALEIMAGLKAVKLSPNRVQLVSDRER